ncbi:MAG TPA: MFS transporter [Burkholderiales bacterium]|nr:MFS transporter [Burkholderiales bacterium]
MRSEPESPYAWLRLSAALALMTLGGSGMYVISVALAPVQAEFGVTRADASFPYTLTMLGFGLGGILMGRLSDRFGVMKTSMIGAIGLGTGFALAGNATTLWQFSLAHGLLIGLLGSSATFAPLVADTALWFNRRRGIAVAICASGNYLAGAVWPPIVQYGFDTMGWRSTYVATGLFCATAMFLLAFTLRQRPPAMDTSAQAAGTLGSDRPLGLSRNALTTVLAIAGVACCVAMSMPQVHIVAYCGDLGYGATNGARMLSIMLAFGIVSRLVSGWICDRIGGLRTLLLGSMLQGIALLLFLPFNGLVSLYIVSAMFGLFQGGIVPAYAIIIREYFPPREAGTRTGIVLMATLFGMALGGWLSGAIFDLTGSYRAAFINGIAWNLVNLTIVVWLMRLSSRAPKAVPA